MTVWTLLRRQADETYVDTGHTCMASEWRAAVWTFLFDDLVGHTKALDLLDKLDGGTFTTFRINSGIYRVVAVKHLDDDEIADLRTLVDADADAILRAITEEAGE